MTLAILIFIGIMTSLAILLARAILALIEPRCGNCIHYDKKVGACRMRRTNTLLCDLCDDWKSQSTKGTKSKKRRKEK